MDKRKAPLKKIIQTDEMGRDMLECGHSVYPPQDIVGAVGGTHRRCWKCYKYNLLVGETAGVIK